MIKRILKNIKDFKSFYSESKNPKSKIVNRVVDFILDLFHQESSQYVIELASIVRKIELERKIEDQKDYSELKYSLKDDHKDAYDKYKSELKKISKSAFLEYYSKYNSDLFEDLDESINWCENTEFYIQYLDTLVSFKKMFLPGREGLESFISIMKNIIENGDY